MASQRVLDMYLSSNSDHIYGWNGPSVTRLGDFLNFGQLFKAFGNN